MVNWLATILNSLSFVRTASVRPTFCCSGRRSFLPSTSMNGEYASCRYSGTTTSVPLPCRLQSLFTSQSMLLSWPLLGFEWMISFLPLTIIFSARNPWPPALSVYLNTLNKTIFSVNFLQNFNVDHTYSGFYTYFHSFNKLERFIQFLNIYFPALQTCYYLLYVQQNASNIHQPRKLLVFLTLLRSELTYINVIFSTTIHFVLLRE